LGRPPTLVEFQNECEMDKSSKLKRLKDVVNDEVWVIVSYIDA
jgi:hypothetical protein